MFALHTSLTLDIVLHVICIAVLLCASSDDYSRHRNVASVLHLLPTAFVCAGEHKFHIRVLREWSDSLCL